jgi:hypothetical protein
MNMEIIQNRYGDDRVIEKISPSKLRVTGESIVSKIRKDDKGNVNMYDFAGGPCLNIGGKINFGKLDWVITKINVDESEYSNLCSVVLEVKM